MNHTENNDRIERTIEEIVNETLPNLMFRAELEKKLKAAHRPAKKPVGLYWSRLSPALSLLALLTALAILMTWLFGKMRPQVGSTGEFTCPVTEPNGSLPPGETVESEYYLGDGKLWTVLWPDGTIYMLPEDRQTDGSYSMKWGWWRGVDGALTIEGRRLDVPDEPLRADIPDGYGETGFQVSTLIFPTTGCWELTGRVGEASLTFVTKVVYGVATPTPNISTDNSKTGTFDYTVQSGDTCRMLADKYGITVEELMAANGLQTCTILIDQVLKIPIKANAAPEPQEGGYNFRGAKLYLAQPLPESPAEANVYSLNKGEQATVDEARALAERFGIQGEIYNAPDTIYKYTVTDGMRWLSIGSSRFFFYTADLVKYTRNSSGTPNDNAETIIREFMQARGFEFPFSISNGDLYGSYALQQIAPDGLSLQYEYFSTPVARVTLDENGEVLTMDANWVDFDQTPVGTYGIITAEEALQTLLDDNVINGKIESVRSGGGTPPQQWYRQYPDEQQVTIYGALTNAPAVDSSKPALLTIDGTMALGNIKGLEALDNYAYIKAIGKYVTENGIRKFMVESWDANAPQDYITGSLRREAGQIVLASDDGKNEYPLIDPPADIPLNTKFPESQLAVSGVIVDGKIDWTYIQYFADASQMGGGGGGGGMGFYQLNLSGTPVPFPTPTPTPSALEVPALTRLDGMRGMLNVNIYGGEDGSQQIELGFISGDPKNPYYLILKGSGLQDLREYSNKPVVIWGMVEGANDFGTLMVNVEKYEIPFPDLKPKILKGIEKSVEIGGQNVVLFTAQDGTVYVEFMPACNAMIPMESMAGTKGGSNTEQGDASILMEALAVPDLSFANYPGICVFTVAPATQADGTPIELTITSDQPNLLPEPPTTALRPPDLTIDEVELIYFVSNPNFQANDPNADRREPYLQPAWHFHGRYESGEEFDAVIQALKREFLSPELAPYIQGG